METTLFVIGIAILICQLICMVMCAKKKTQKIDEKDKIHEEIEILSEDLEALSEDLKTLKADIIKAMSEGQMTLKTEVIKEVSEGQLKMQTSNAESLTRIQEMIFDRLIKLQESTEERLNRNNATLNKSLMEGIEALQKTTEKKLTEIQDNVDAKLEKNLNERLDQSFKQVGEQLKSLYESLGELKSLESGVSNLNRTLSNVKARGIYGEMALENILANILDKAQYDTNVATKPRATERVEFAVKIPDKENKGFIYLPIDSKFPSDIYGKVLEAAEAADPAALKSATDELKARIRKEAMTIRDKYVSPPHTTDFAIMFLPTEGLYSEVLRIDGLVEECQDKYKIVISGPTTITALLNSLSVGFKYLTVNKKSEEIMKLLGNFKKQFEKFNGLIEETQKKIAGAQKATDELQRRSGMIQGKLDKVEVVDYEDGLLEVNED